MKNLTKKHIKRIGILILALIIEYILSWIGFSYLNGVIGTILGIIEIVTIVLLVGAILDIPIEFFVKKWESRQKKLQSK